MNLVEKAKTLSYTWKRYPHTSEELDLTLAYFNGDISYTQYKKTINNYLGRSASGANLLSRMSSNLLWGIKNGKVDKIYKLLKEQK